jgi:uncharacterized protein (UPF0335 family)
MNIDGKTRAYFERAVRIEQEKRDVAESAKDLKKEMKGTGLTVEEVAGIALAVKQHFETEEKKAKREAAEEVADALSDTPLGKSAAARDDGGPGPKAMKIIKRMQDEGVEFQIALSPEWPVAPDLAAAGYGSSHV